MPEDPGAVPIDRRLRYAVRAQRAAVSVLVLAIGVLLTVLAVGFFTPLSAQWPFPLVNSVTDQPSANYNLVFVVLGPIIAVVGTYFVGAYYVARRKFEHLMMTKSKAEFLRNIPEVEDLLWDLTPNDELRYQQKRGDLRLRR